MWADITEDEVCLAIKALKVNKHPGPDGFTALFYKKLPDILVPYLTMFNSLKKDYYFSTDMLQASIVVLLKLEKDTQSWANFCWFPLINVDVKLLTKVRTSFLNKILHHLVLKDQTGFVPLQQVTDNVCCTLLLIHLAHC